MRGMSTLSPFETRSIKKSHEKKDDTFSSMPVCLFVSAYLSAGVCICVLSFASLFLFLSPYPPSVSPSTISFSSSSLFISLI